MEVLECEENEPIKDDTRCSIGLCEDCPMRDLPECACYLQFLEECALEEQAERVGPEGYVCNGKF